MKDLIPQEELEEKFLEKFNKLNLEELYWIKEILEKEIRLSETAIKEGYEKKPEGLK